LKNNGAEVHFAFLRAKTSYTVENGSITVTAEPCDKKSEIHYMDFRIPGISPQSLEKYEVLSEEEKASGVITRKIPSDAGSFKVYYRNSYGIWTHPLTPIEK
jgi:maltooligosyltrehalose synthase